MRIKTLAAAVCALGSGFAHAANVTPDIIFGGGNANGGFTVETFGDLELGLRGKLRYNDAGSPENTFNQSGNIYTFQSTAGTPSGRSVFNFEWSINSDTADGSDALDTYRYEILFDIDPTSGTTYVTYDPLSSGSTGAYFGNNSSSNGGAAFIPNTSLPGTFAANANVAQNSVNYAFVGGPLGKGMFDIVLRAFDANAGSGAEPVASTAIQVQVVPVPGALPLMLGGIAGFAALRRRMAR